MQIPFRQSLISHLIPAFVGNMGQVFFFLTKVEHSSLSATTGWHVGHGCFEMTSSMCGFGDVVMSHFRSITSQQLRHWRQISSSCWRDLKAPANTHLNCPTAPSRDVCGGSMPYFFPFVFPRPLSLDTACMMNPFNFYVCMHAPPSLAGRSDDSFPTVA
jgi:hypothetical protein